MFSLVRQYSASLMFFAAVLGFIFPEISDKVFGFLPQVLFTLMFLTLIGVEQKCLCQALLSKTIWLYGLVHGAVLTCIICGLAYLLGLSGDLLLAISAVTATGSLFATPAIVKSLGFDPLEAMAMTIVSTLLMPCVLFINLSIFSFNEFSLDIQAYFLRLAIFIVGPMALAHLSVIMFDYKRLRVFQEKIAPFTLFLVFSFPFGLIGSFSYLFRSSPEHAFFLLLSSIVLISSFFFIGFISFLYKGIEKAFISGITLGNRNLLLTYTVAGPYLGDEYLALVGALQLPMFALPWISKTLWRGMQKVVLQPN